MPVDPFGDALVRGFIRAALLTYAVSLLTRGRLGSVTDWEAATRAGSHARCWWTISFLLYATHVALAFHYYHNWSHADAIARTREMSGFGEGIYVSHAFTLVWGLDVLCWWFMPGRYARRSVWVDRLLHGFMLFIIINGAVIFAEGLVRWLSVLGLIVLLVWWCLLRPGQDHMSS